jgi:hypothetical protein
MSRTLQKRVSGWMVLTLVGAVGLVIVGAFALTKPLPEYLIAKGTVLPGEELRSEAFEPRRVELGSLSGMYLKPEDLQEDLVFSEVILSGELIPKRMLVGGVQSHTSIVLRPSLPVSSQIEPGSWVQIWRTVSTPDGFIGEQLIPFSQVISISDDGSLISDQSAEVEVSISQEQAGILLPAISSENAIFLLLANSR